MNGSGTAWFVAIIITCYLLLFVCFTTSMIGVALGFVVGRLTGRKFRDVAIRWTWMGAAAGVVITCALSIYLFGFFPSGREELVASARSSDGVEFRVIQSFTSEPYQVTFVVKFPDQLQWSAFYIEHEDFRWRRASFVVDESKKEARLIKGRRQAASYDWSTATFNLTYGFNRSTAARDGQWQMPPDWVPPTE